MTTAYYHPLDPKCPAVMLFDAQVLNDEITISMGAPIDELKDNFERKHRIVCERCQRYGAANVEIRKVS
jgi:hypothetical protein